MKQDLDVGFEIDEGAGLFDAATALARDKLAAVGIALVVTVGAILVSFLIPPTYTARTLLLPPQQGQSSAASALAVLGVLSSGLGGAGVVKSPEELYIALLKSDSVTDSLVQRFKLVERYRSETASEARLALGKRVVMTADRKSGLIRVEVDDGDASFAADMANAYSEELRKLMNRLAVTEASQRRMFFDQQAQRAKDALAQAEIAFKAAQEKFGIQSVDVRAQGDIRAAAELRAQMVTRGVQLQAMRSFAGPDNADARRITAEIASLREQLVRIEHGTGTDSASSEQALANQRAYREVKYQEAVLSGLITQAELARGDEARQAPLVQQVDVARPPDKRSAPKRRVIAMIALAVGVVLGIGFVLLRQSWRNAQARPQTAARWRRLRDAWRGAGPPAPEGPSAV